MSNLIKSGFLVAILLFATLLTACGSSDDSKKTDTKTEKKAEAKTKMYTDVLKREVEIPTNPKKVVALLAVGEMLELGMKPIASTKALMVNYTEEQREGIEEVGSSSAEDFEKILSLTPDLIIVPSYTEEDNIEKFSKIAPTVTTIFYDEPIASIKRMGVVLNKEAEAKAWVKDYDTHVNEARDELKSLDIVNEKAVVLQLVYKSIQLYRKEIFPTIFDSLQFKFTDYQAKLEENKLERKEISKEALPKFKDADRIFLVMADGDAKATYENLAKSSIWQGLPAVKKKQVYTIDTRLNADVATMNWALDEVMRLLKGEK